MAGRLPYETPVLYLLVFCGGFANLAAEIIGPRMFASLFGDTTIVWAVLISVTLVGLAVGYSLGGRVPRERVRALLPPILLANAGWLLAVSWLVWEVPAGALAGGIAADASLIFTIAFAAFFVPSALFGTLSPMAISLLAVDRPPDAVSRVVGNVYAVGTIGSVSGALAAAFLLIPWAGLTLSLRAFAIGLCLFALYFYAGRRWLPAAAIIVCLIFPQPGFVWVTDDGLNLLAQREGFYQTIRVYGDDDTVQMHLGPSYQSRIDRQTREPTFNYAQAMLSLTGPVDRARVLMLGGAGHAMAYALEARGATVTEVEIDPVVVQLSDQYFGPISGEVAVADGRAYIARSAPDRYDLILIDAFDSAANVPPQLATREFFAAARRALAPGGRLIYNFTGTPEGSRSRSFRALAATISAVFPYAAANNVTGTDSQNIIFVAAESAPPDLDLQPIPTDGIVLTDDRNPVEILALEAREGTYWRR